MKELPYDDSELRGVPGNTAPLILGIVVVIVCAVAAYLIKTYVIDPKNDQKTLQEQEYQTQAADIRAKRDTIEYLYNHLRRENTTLLIGSAWMMGYLARQQFPHTPFKVLKKADSTKLSTMY